MTIRLVRHRGYLGKFPPSPPSFRGDWASLLPSSVAPASTAGGPLHASCWASVARLQSRHCPLPVAGIARFALPAWFNVGRRASHVAGKRKVPVVASYCPRGFKSRELATAGTVSLV